MFKRLIEWLKIKPKGIDTTSIYWPFSKPDPIAKSKPRPQVKKTTPRKVTKMPLTKSKSKEAFKSNVKAEIKAGKKPDQAVAIAYAVKREVTKKTKPKRV